MARCAWLTSLQSANEVLIARCAWLSSLQGTHRYITVDLPIDMLPDRAHRGLTVSFHLGQMRLSCLLTNLRPSRAEFNSNTAQQFQPALYRPACLRVHG